MHVAEKQILDIPEYCRDVALRAKAAAGQLAQVRGAVKDDWLRRSATLLRAGTNALLDANSRDVAAAPGFGLADAAIDRLRLTGPRIDAVAKALEEVALLPDPVGEVIGSSVRPNGLSVQKVRVP